MVRPAKAQVVRLLDVAVIGPVMSVGGVVAVRAGRPWIGYALFGLGVGTMIYNGMNYEWLKARGGGC